MTPAQVAHIMALVRNHGELSAERAHYLVLRRSMSDIESALRDAPQAEPGFEPLFYYRPVCNGEMYEGPIWAKSVGGQMRMAENPPGSWKPLFGYPPDAQFTKPPEIDYDLLIAACYGRTGQAQGTKGCVQFAKGAEWYREQIAATPSAPTAVEPDEPLKWCSYCGEGVTTFCRGKQSPDWDYKCPVLNLPARASKGTP